MGIIRNKARVATFVSAVALMVMGCATSMMTGTEETKLPIKVEVVPEQEPAMIDEITTLTVELQEKRKPLRGRGSS